MWNSHWQPDPGAQIHGVQPVDMQENSDDHASGCTPQLICRFWACTVKTAISSLTHRQSQLLPPVMILNRFALCEGLRCIVKLKHLQSSGHNRLKAVLSNTSRYGRHI